MIDRNFFKNNSKTVAQELLGKFLCRKMPNGEIRKMIIMETEAYPANDSACYGYGYGGNHGNRKKTAANAPLFESNGTCCIYGGMILVVCGEIGKPDNVLVRAGIYNDNYYDGPCKVAHALGADKNFHGVDMLNKNSKLWVEENSDKKSIIAITRKGLCNCVCDDDRNRKLRFFAL